MLCAFVATPATSADGVDPKADGILKAMSSYLAATRAFSMNAEVALEVVMRNGQKLQLMSTETLAVRRPSEFRIHVKGMVADADFVFDGKMLTLYGRKPNVYVQRAVAYVGTAYVDGIECHHLAFREDQFDWQLWVQAGEKPLPMRYVITSTWQTGAPQLEVSLRDWNTSPQISDKQFTFRVPEGARKLDAMPNEDIDDVDSVKEGP
jgi:hypothetical protein